MRSAGALKLVVAKREECARIHQRQQEQQKQHRLELHDIQEVIENLIKAVVFEERASVSTAVAQSAQAETANSELLLKDGGACDDIQEVAKREENEVVLDTSAHCPPSKIVSPGSDEKLHIPNATPVIRCEAAAPEIGNQLFAALSSAATERTLCFAGDARASRLYVLRAGPSGGGRTAGIEDSKGPAIRKMEGAVNDQVNCHVNVLPALCDVCVQGRGSSFEATSSEVEERSGKHTEFSVI